MLLLLARCKTACAVDGTTLATEIESSCYSAPLAYTGLVGETGSPDLLYPFFTLHGSSTGIFLRTFRTALLKL